MAINIEKMKVFPFIFLFLTLLPFSSFSNDTTEIHIHKIKIHYPTYVIGEEFAEISIEAISPNGVRDSIINGKMEFFINQESKFIDFKNGLAYSTLEINHSKDYEVSLKDNNQKIFFRIRYLPPWISILPPLLAIFLALITKEVLTSLFLSIFLGVLTLKGFELSNLIPALFTVVDTYILDTLKDTKHLSVILFSFLIGGMVAVISQNGGMKGLASVLSKFAHSARSSQFVSFFLSFVIFYDNYANTLIVGNTMRPVTDKYKVSREKLAFIVHGTAASVTSIAFISTWIGAELGYINDATSSLGISERTYSLFLHSLQFAFYPVLMLFFIFFLIVLKKDFGPMNSAEVEARSVGIIKDNKMNENEEIQEDLKMIDHSSTGKYSWLTAFIPIITFIIVAFAGLIITGAKQAYEHLIQFHFPMPEYSFAIVWKNATMLQSHHKEGFFYKLGVLINYSDFYIPLLWSSFTGITMAIFLAVIKKGISLRSTMGNLIHGFRIMLSAVIILVFAWALAQVVEDLHTTDYIASLISSKILFPQLLPAIVFILSAIFSFATGSVWGTMAILYPLIIPVSWTLSLQAGLPITNAQKILYMILASIITGSLFGNHCSPISDTTTVSSISSNCDLVAHIRTQVPYSLVVATISLFLLIFSQAGLHWSINYLIGVILIFLLVKYNGRAVE